MASGQSPELRTILERLQGSERLMARQMAADERAEIRSMPAEIREVEFPFTARHYYARVVQAIAEGRELSDAELADVRSRGAQRALEGFPLHLFVHNWLRGASILWDSAVEAAEPDETAGLVELGTGILAILDQAIGAGMESFASAAAAIDSHDRGDTGLVARLLLEGQDAPAVARQRGIRLASRYDVVALWMAPGEDELTGQPAASDVARRRKLLRIATALHRAELDDVLTCIEPDGGHLLVPHPDDAPDDVDVARCHHVLTVIGEAVGVDVVATVATAARHDTIPAAAAEALEMLEVARAAGLGQGLHTVADLAVRVQANRPGSARDHLLSVLDRLSAHPEIIATLDRLLALDGDRNRTARALRVHPNTVNNRLAKAQRLLGFDPTSTQGVVTLYAALAARSVTNSST